RAEALGPRAARRALGQEPPLRRAFAHDDVEDLRRAALRRRRVRPRAPHGLVDTSQPGAAAASQGGPLVTPLASFPDDCPPEGSVVDASRATSHIEGVYDY